MKTIIPAKRHSIRVKDKNWRPFSGQKNLVEIKIEQLLESQHPNDIYLSCEDPEIKALADKYKIHFILRSPGLASDNTSWPDALKGMIEELPVGEDEDILWVEVVNPLFDQYQSMTDTWARVKGEHDSLVLVAPFNKFLIKENGQPLNFMYGKWHSMSQHMEPVYSWDSACIMKKRDLIYFSYPIGKTPYLFKTNEQCVDIDTLEDFELAQILYTRKTGGTL
jgi:CMP-N-acetylneuraminic acid synthetase